MGNINYDRLVRVLTRCAELAAAPGKPPILALVYKESAEAKINTFLQAHSAVNKAVTAWTKENREALAALDALDAPYRVARSVVLAMVPETVLPDTLKAEPTDTDKLNAIDALIDAIDDHAGKPWADELLQGEFGQKAPQTAKELHEAIAAGTARSDALTARAMAFGPANDAYLAFKRVVRSAMGPSSKDYRRIHLRASPGAAGKSESDDVVVEPASPDAPATETAAPTPPPADGRVV